MKQIPVYTATGRSGRKVELPDELFGQKPASRQGGPNERLLAQAYYVYQARAHTGKHKTKIRGEVRGTTAKWYRQKGTGRARHGSRRAPIFVGGGVAHGPSGLKKERTLSQPIARQALAIALSRRLREGKIAVFDAGKMDGKTKTAISLLQKIGIDGNVLILHAHEKELVRATRNIPGVTLVPASQVNAYEVINLPAVVVTTKGIELMKETFGKQKKKRKAENE